MEKEKWIFVNAENVVPYICDETYSSKQLTGGTLGGAPVININEGTSRAAAVPRAAHTNKRKSTIL